MADRGNEEGFGVHGTVVCWEERVNISRWTTPVMD